MQRKLQWVAESKFLPIDLINRLRTLVSCIFPVRPDKKEALMTTTPTPPAGPTPTPAPAVPTTAGSQEIRIYSHSSIYYWWPVWACGYILAILTYTSGTVAPIIPIHSIYQAATNSIVLPQGTPAPGSNNIALESTEPGKPPRLGEHMSENKNLGVIFTIVLLMVVFITNTPLRGLWSAVFLLLVLVGYLTLQKWGWTPKILHFFNHISIHMNMGFYIFFSTVLCILWFAVVFGFDRMHYWVFRPGQVTFEAVFGGGQKSYDAAGMVFEKQLSDIFRHYMLGLGSGDLIITFGGAANREPIHIPNVLFLTQHMIRRLENMVAEKPD
jgi:hypothetical protein